MGTKAFSMEVEQRDPSGEVKRATERYAACPGDESGDGGGKEIDALTIHRARVEMETS